MLKKISLFAVALFSLHLTACTRDGGLSSSGKSLEGADSKTPRVVNLAIWSNFISPELVADFEKKTGIRIQMSHYSSNEELLAKLQAGASGYDVVVPSDYMVFVMAKLGLIREIDQSQLPNAKDLDPRYMHKSFDPQNKYGMPYDWGTTGIAIHRDLYKGQIRGWKDLFEKDDLIGKFSLLDDAREVLGAALKAQGFSMNSRNPDELQKAKQLLLKVRKRVKAFTSEPLMSMVNRETAVAHIYMSDALQARKATGGKIEYLVPEEGGTFWIDSLSIPTQAPHLKEAHALINFLLEAKSNVSTTMNVFTAPVNKHAFAMLPLELQKSKMLFPPQELLAKCELIEDLGDFAGTWDRIWTEIKAQRD